MQVEMYGVKLATGWSWRLTVHSETDHAFWAGKERIVLVNKLSVGTAVMLIDVLEKQPDGTGRDSDRRMAEEQLQQAARRLRKACVHVPELKLLRQASNPSGFACFGMDSGGCYKGANPVEQAAAGKLASHLQGRSLLLDELQQWLETAFPGSAPVCWEKLVQQAYLQGTIQLTGGLAWRFKRSGLFSLTEQVEYRCRRCGSEGSSLYRSTCASCGEPCVYCQECLTMGRTKRCSLLIAGAVHMKRQPGIASMNAAIQSAPPSAEAVLAHWNLSAAQRHASAKALEFLAAPAEESESLAGGRGENTSKSRGVSMRILGRIKALASVRSEGKEECQKTDAACPAPPEFLVWAVTGAGKTEMIYPLIEFELSRGGRVLVAAPRRDVVLELKPRLAKAFPQTRIVALYGGSEERWERGQLVLSTTHQLLRFSRCFNLVIVDELDAFPYHNNPVLQYAARKVCSPSGKYVFLSATPPPSMQRDAARGLLPHVRVPVRYHRHPLPVPRLLRCPQAAKMNVAGSVPASLLQLLAGSIDRGAQCFIFVSRIKEIHPLVALLQHRFAAISVQGTSSQDADRAAKVQQFRDGAIRLLVTTTILERGVTVPRTDVFVLDADSPLFDESSLVQMAGRAGRSAEDPAGRVYFLAPVRTAGQVRAVRQIAAMNRLAASRGYLKEAER